MAMIRLLTFTSLYPNPVSPRLGIFVEHRLRKLVETRRVVSCVVAPVPRMPIPRGLAGGHGKGTGVPSRDQRFGIEIRHPKFMTIPGLAVWANPLLMALGALPTLKHLQRTGHDFDVIDAQYFYPDGVAGAILGAWLHKPVVITARGTDVNVLSRYAVPRAWIRWAAARASGLITVSQALKQVLVNLGVSAGHIEVLRNGVDLEVFSPGDRHELRHELNLYGPILLSVGNLVPEKGHDLVLAALARISNVDLIIIGSGPEEPALRELARRLGVASRVRWISNLDQLELARYYRTADATILASSREGMPNVLLESIACGTPVIATDVGGNAEVVQAPEGGRLVKERSAEGLAAAWHQFVTSRPERAATRAYANRFSWQEPVAGQLRLLESIVERHRAGAGGANP
jgi:teichuronic acid biosynthesis glycosyltransferase TuaC